MEALKYKVIRSRAQYDEYCRILEGLVFGKTSGTEEEVDLLTLLIQDWDRRQYDEEIPDPIRLIRLLMKEHGLKAVDLAGLLGLSRGAVSNILNYRRRLTADNIRILATHFGIRQEALNRAYDLIGSDEHSLV